MTRRSRRTQAKPWQAGDEVLGYIRVSKVGARGDALISPDVQKRLIEQWAAREHVTVAEWVEDVDKSGRDMSKRQIAASIKRVEAGEVAGIAVWKISRWGRNLLESATAIKELRHHGGFIGSATENLEEIDTPMGKFSLTQMLALAELQSDQIGETWEGVMDYRRFDRRLPGSGGPRFGYVYHGNQDNNADVYTPDSTTGPWLAKCYREYIAGRSLSSLVLELDRNGIRSVNGNRIIYRSLLATLDSGFGAGLLVDRRDAPRDAARNPNEWEFTPGAHEPVIDEITWQAYLQKRKIKRSPREASPVHKLAGLLYCASCGSKMLVKWKHSAPGEKYRMIVCRRRVASRAVTNTPSCENSASISQTAAEDMVKAWLVKHVRQETLLDAERTRKATSARAEANIAAIDSELSTAKRRLSRLTDLILDEEDEEQKDTYKTRQRELREEIRLLQEQRHDLEVGQATKPVPTQDALTALLRVWDKGSPEMINSALQHIIERVEVHPGPRATKRISVKPTFPMLQSV